MFFRKFSRALGTADLFAKDVSFRENNGQSFTTIFGSLVSILICSVTALYAFNKTVILLSYEDTNLTHYVEVE